MRKTIATLALAGSALACGDDMSDNCYDNNPCIAVIQEYDDVNEAAFLEFVPSRAYMVTAESNQLDTLRSKYSLGDTVEVVGSGFDNYVIIGLKGEKKK